MSKAPSVKTLSYVTGPNQTAEVAFVILPGKRCIFTGLTRRLSTINYAESIVEVICSSALSNFLGFGGTDYTFFDLQTGIAYGQDGRPNGEYDYDRLEIHWDAGPHVRRWVSEDCPPEVLSLFWAEIGANPRRSQF